MNLQLEKKALKNEIDQLEDENLLLAIKAILNYTNHSKQVWEDEAFVQELDRRSEDFKSGKSKSYTWEEVKAKARKQLKQIQSPVNEI